MDQFLQTLISGLIAGAIYAVAALGFTIVYNATKIMNFAHGEFLMMGALLSALLISMGIHALLSVLAAVLVVTVLGLALDLLAIQRARQRTILTSVMITIGAGIAFRGLMVVTVGRDVLFVPAFPGIPAVTAGNIYLPAQGVWIIAMLLLLSVGLWFVYEKTKLGKSMRAASDNPRAASLCGINPAIMSATAFALASSTGALAGAFVAPVSSAFYESGLFFGLKGFSAAMLGGLGNPLGAVVGGVIIGVAEALTAGYLTSNFKDAVALSILIAVLLLRPDGLLGRVEARRV